jgi:hypothetical protein
MRKKIIGIDPGKDTGLAIFEGKTLIQTQSINTYEAIKFLQENKQDIDYVVIESSAKQSFIWNKNNKSTNAFGRHARNIGSVDGVVRVIIECCEAENIKVETISPLQKGKKWNSEEFKQYFQEYTKKTNQHERDAAICVIKAGCFYL